VRGRDERVTAELVGDIVSWPVDVVLQDRGDLGRSTISKIKNEKSIEFDDEHAWDDDGVSAGADDD
jgi:hypothetical protein